MKPTHRIANKHVPGVVPEPTILEPILGVVPDPIDNQDITQSQPQ